ncbi:GNAT family N-acetyltransferase [Pseudomonas sp. Gutcm_11s]|uniref:GNAT family N-acetyltransferase n=1 Tax=Pseudomonas sp. Gutcm_11s TaxID=3026088 RepID=UPI00235FD633|nr:GNAT family N-acetyltransferase [Pseudomonas sp. Gutcm_11s]MDD0842815.1 GNAT family N-acetyltransferase [Pseudomonas sp. Gutcm_11s]
MSSLATLTTPRLTLRPLQLADAPAIQALFPQWEIVRYLADRVPWPYPADGALSFMRDVSLPAMREGREWHWSIRLTAQPETLIGVISLSDEPDNNRGFWLDPRHQRQGLMQEACAAATAYWFEVLQRPVLRAPKAVPNIASSRISARGGMRLVEVIEKNYVSGRLPSELWEITREEWLAHNARGNPGAATEP